MAKKTTSEESGKADKQLKNKEKTKTRRRPAPRSPDAKILAKNKDKGGRPSLLTQETQDKIVTLVRAGNYLETAAAFAGINKDTLYDWMRQGARGKSPEMIAFSDSIKKALAESEATDLELIKKAAREGSWQASAWRLERRFRDRWGKSLEVGDLKNKTNEELLALLEEADTTGIE